MTDKSLSWYDITDLVPALETLRQAAAGTRINVEHPRWCRTLAWPHFRARVAALVGPSCGSEKREVLRWSSLDVARLVVFLALPGCPPGCEHKHELRERAETRELAEVGM